ncbi:MAG: universal stress protein [Proteobacteria bacterium]|nr:universal stress protein [Pseudomonadota bacterium]MBU1581216.1 universal stress protein [Pseudomonadota bacterium]MBU2452863.1 universal stress protein [Pseudomonadota bacterium]MBU2631264.1 universal stress protein [Pseudomonadota bacterium]
MFKKILFATSTTNACDPAARVAFNISTLYKAWLKIFHVIEKKDPGEALADVDEKSILEVNEIIKTYYAEHLSKPGNHEIKTILGDPCGRILEEIQRNKPDLLVMGVSAGGEKSLGNDIETAGSTFQTVVKASQCPVLIVNRAAASFWGAISNVVFATDFSKTSDQAFDFACRLAKKTGCELHIFHAQNTSLTPESQVFDQNAIEARIREKLRFSRKKYGSKMEGIENYAIEVWEGTAYIEIVKYARENYADLIIMAQDSQNPGSQTDELGSTVKQVILRAGCPVLCINKPKRP